jgi:flagellar capping protein FliD
MRACKVPSARSTLRSRRDRRNRGYRSGWRSLPHSTHRETGAEQAFSLASDDDSISFSSVQAATDAQLNVNGIDFTRSSNVIDDVLTGVSLTLNTTDDWSGKSEHQPR